MATLFALSKLRDRQPNLLTVHVSEIACSLKAVLSVHTVKALTHKSMSGVACEEPIRGWTLPLAPTVVWTFLLRMTGDRQRVNTHKHSLSLFLSVIALNTLLETPLAIEHPS